MRAVLFDLDGTLIDNMAYYHARTWLELAKGVRAGTACGAYTVGFCSSDSASALANAGTNVAIVDFTSEPSAALARLGLLAA